VHIFLSVIVSHVLAAVPNPGQGTAPPGSGKFLTILQWIAWGAFGVCVLGVMASGATMGISRRRGEGGEHAQGLGMALVGCVIVGSASALVGALA